MEQEHTAVALGIFDGVHTGHRSVISTAVRYAESESLISAVCTFDTASVNTKGAGYKPIYSDEQKRHILRSLGIGRILSLPFGEIRSLSAKEFLSEFVFGQLGAVQVICGSDFRLGKGAECGVTQLERLCREFGAGLIVADDVTDGGEKISSARIRKLISEGNIEEANVLLGEDYTVHGEVVKGNMIGRKLDFPTANQIMDADMVLPKFGVYASYAEIDGTVYKGVSNIGVKPTVGSDRPLCETHFPGYDGDLYSRMIDVRLTGFIRPEKRFSGLDELRVQIALDTELALR